MNRGYQVLLSVTSTCVPERAARRHVPARVGATGSTGGPVALVLGGGALEVIRPLQLAGIRCAVVAARGDPASFAARARPLFAWDWTRPQRVHDGALANRLLAWAWTQPEAPALFYSCDQALLFVSRHRDQLERGFRFALPEADLVEALADKARFAALADRVGLPVPESRLLTGQPGEAPPDLSALGYPVLIKPDRRDRAWRDITNPAGAKVKAVVLDSPEHLRKTWPTLAVLGHTLVAQRYISGGESAIESYHVYVDHTGDIAAEFTGAKIRTWPLECGFTTACAITDQDDLARLGRELVRLLHFRGIAKFDFKRGPDGRLYLLEINARPSLWHHPGARAGINIPATVYADLTGRPRPSRSRRRGRPVRWVHPRDFLAARAAGQPLIRWLWFVAGARAKAFWSWRDPMPLLRVALSRLINH